MAVPGSIIRNPMTPETAEEELRAGRPLIGRSIERLNLEKVFVGAAGPIEISDCTIQQLFGARTLEWPISLKNSAIEDFELAGWYFIKGMTISNCLFAGEARFLFGGHNKDGPILIQDTTFRGFADFTDGLFMGPVIFRNVRFESGTNLLGMHGGTQVSFYVKPIFENVTGELHSTRWFGQR